MLESLLREFGRERAAEAGRTELLRERLCAHYLLTALKAADQNLGSGQAAWISRMRRAPEPVGGARHRLKGAARIDGRPADVRRAVVPMGEWGDRRRSLLADLRTDCTFVLIFYF